MGFIIVLILTTIAIAGSAAFFSIYGLAQIFSGAFAAVIIMASSLEAGKLIAASYVYRFWYKISWVMRSYLITAILALMLITSAGIFGFLSQAHLQSNAQLTQVQANIVSIEQDKTRNAQLKEERLERRRQIDEDIAKLPNNFITGRQRLMNSYGEERKRIDQEILTYDTNIENLNNRLNEAKLSEIQTKSHVGPILFIAEAMGKDVNTAITWMIVLIMFAFDPLAVVLTIGVNVALKHHTKPEKKEDPQYEDQWLNDNEQEHEFMQDDVEEHDKWMQQLEDEGKIPSGSPPIPEQTEDPLYKSVANYILRRNQVKKQIRNP